MNELLIASLLGVVVLGADILKLRKAVLGFIVLALLAIPVLVYFDWNTNVDPFSNGMILMDNFALAFSGTFASITLLWFLLSKPYFSQSRNSTDLYALVLFSLCGAIVMSSYTNLVMLFLGIEILSIPMYVLAASHRGDILSNEAGFKYFFLGAFASATLLFGIALIYGASGSFDLGTIRDGIIAGNYPAAWMYSGVILILAGFAFKVSVAPFHLWAPDVYQGSPTVVTALMATVVKGAAFAALYRLFAVAFPSLLSDVTTTIVWLSGITLIVANVVGSVQTNVKRLLAYSSISHAGFMVAAVLISPQNAGGGTLLYYVITYSVASLASFMVVYFVAAIQNGNDDFEAFRGLVKRNPLLAGTMTLALLSMAGIPPLSGFMAKYLVIASALQGGHIALVIIMVLTSVVAVYYYLKLITIMFSPIENAGRIVTGRAERWVLVLLSILLFALTFAAGIVTTVI